MITKKELNSFILKEAFKILKEEDINGKIKELEDNYLKQVDMLELDINELTKDIKKNISNQQALAQQGGLKYDRAPAEKQVVMQNLSYLKNEKPAKEKLIQSKKEQIIDLGKEKDMQIKSLKDVKSAESKTSNEIGIQEAMVSPQVKKTIIQKPVLKPNLTPQVKQDIKSQTEKPVNIENEPKESKKDVIVRFDTNTPTPFTVRFSRRGFIVGNTRISFEMIEKAISKQFSITLKTGLVLTPVKMQKILKYKNRY
jgi:hypothetical protein